MAEVVQEAQQEFWQSPAVLDPVVEAMLPAAPAEMAEACGDCGTEFMIGARFCHTCGRRRPVMSIVGSWFGSLAEAWSELSLPGWLHYLHFHEIKRWVGLPTAALIAFMIGLGCVAGALGVSLFYKASTLAEFQAIQMWRIEWLLAATASFVAGILLKKPSDDDRTNR
jgi:hypothetical protein